MDRAKRLLTHGKEACLVLQGAYICIYTHEHASLSNELMKVSVGVFCLCLFIWHRPRYNEQASVSQYSCLWPLVQGRLPFFKTGEIACYRWTFNMSHSLNKAGCPV